MMLAFNILTLYTMLYYKSLLAMDNFNKSV